MSQRVDKKIRVVCNGILKDLMRGSSLAVGMRRQKHFFHELGIMLISAGEESGRLEEVAYELADYYEKQSELKKFVIKAALYPSFLLLAAIAVLIFFMFYVLPVLATAYTSMQIKPQGMLALILQIQGFVKEHMFSVLGSLLLLGICLAKAKGLIFRLLIRLPILGKLYYLLLEIRFCKLMALLLNSGVSINDAVSITKRVIQDEMCLRKLDLFQARLKKGAEIDLAANCLSGWLSPLALGLINIGAVTGYLPSMLEQASSIGEQDLQNGLDRVKEILSPMLLLIVALVIAGVVCSVIGPLFNLISALPE